MAAILGSAIGFIDGTIVSIALPAMRDSLGATLAEGQWINNAYLLPLAALILLGGALGDRFGLARAFSGGLALFIAGSLGCAAAPSPEALIAARAVKGIGAAIMVPQSLALIARAYPAAERGRAIGIWAAASALTTALGPILGGAVLSLGGAEAWRWLFAANLPLGGLAIWLLVAHVARDPARPNQPLDFPGAVLATAGLGLIAYGLTGAGDGVTLWPVVAAGGAVMAVFVLVEAHSAHPMMPLALFANPVFAAANAVTFTLYFALSSILFFLPMTVIAGWGVPEAAASAALAPMALLIAALSTRTGDWAQTYGAGRLISGGAAIVAASFAALALSAPAMAFWSVTVPLGALLGLGMGLVVGPLSTAVMSALPEARTGTGSAINNAVSRMAGLISVAAMGTVAALAYRTAGGPLSFGAPGAAAGHAAAMNAGFAAVAWATAALALASSLLAALFIRRV
jgi:EmrB/QacA subfamily drug resistance transporter